MTGETNESYQLSVVCIGQRSSFLSFAIHVLSSGLWTKDFAGIVLTFFCLHAVYGRYLHDSAKSLSPHCLKATLSLLSCVPPAGDAMREWVEQPRHFLSQQRVLPENEKKFLLPRAEEVHFKIVYISASKCTLQAINPHPSYLCIRCGRSPSVLDASCSGQKKGGRTTSCQVREDYAAAP